MAESFHFGGDSHEYRTIIQIITKHEIVDTFVRCMKIAEYT